MSPRQYFGSAGHFIGSESCRFHLLTLIGDVVVSTVGDYAPESVRARAGDLQTVAGGRSIDAQKIGSDRYFETMVFRSFGPCGCGCGMPDHDGSCLESSSYQTRAEANAGHEAMCRQIEKRLARTAEKPVKERGKSNG